MIDDTNGGDILRIIMITIPIIDTMIDGMIADTIGERGNDRTEIIGEIVTAITVVTGEDIPRDTNTRLIVILTGRDHRNESTKEKDDGDLRNDRVILRIGIIIQRAVVAAAVDITTRDGMKPARGTGIE